MTDTDKIKIMKHVKYKKHITRQEIQDYCKKLKSNCDLSMLQDNNDAYIVLTSKPVWDTGVYVAKPDDVFALSDYGHDILHRNFINNAKTVYPYAISTIAVLISLAALIVSVIALL